ncbi:MAG: amidohydrolase family protein [Pseudolabrys sp.]|jgi:predicted amidohydrolase YtcJ
MKTQSRVSLLAALSLLAGAAMVIPGPAHDRDDDRCAGSRDVKLVNGKIHTFDARNSIVSSATIKHGKFVEVGDDGHSDGGPCMQVINLGGRTAIPGLVDNHNHFILLGLRPGHDTRLETAASIADVQAAIRARTKTVKAGQWITAMGGWVPGQFKENRLPTLTELNDAAPNNPVLVFQTFFGPATTNKLGKTFLSGKGVTVDDAGNIAADGSAIAALNVLRGIQTFDDKKQGMLDAMAYSASVGVTTNVDMGGFVLPGSPHTEGSDQFDTLASWDPFTAYDPLLALYDEGKVSVRVRIFFLSMDTDNDHNATPLTTQRVLNAFSNFGDDMVRSSGIGEFVTSWPLFGGSNPRNYPAALTIVAQRGWAFQQHSLSLMEDRFTADTFEFVNKTTPIADLRWSIAHVPFIDLATINRLKAIGAGVAVHAWRYLSNATSPTPLGPPYRTIIDSGVRVGAGSDSAQISTLNPWNMIYYMVTGKNAGGNQVNLGQHTTREEAIRLYTVNNGWFLKEESKLGSIEVGKLGDVVVLSDDYFNPVKVPDEKIRNLHPVLTVVDGKVVYSLLHY